MTDETTNRAASDLWMRLWAPWVSLLAPRDLTQPINPGWSFGNVIVNQRNSRSPETEQAILAEESYGRQIGKLLEAVHALIEQVPGNVANPAFKDIELLRDKVERLKREAAANRIDQLKSDLELLKVSDKAAYEAKVEALRSLLPEPRGASA